LEVVNINLVEKTVTNVTSKIKPGTDNPNRKRSRDFINKSLDELSKMSKIQEIAGYFAEPILYRSLNQRGLKRNFKLLNFALYTAGFKVWLLRYVLPLQRGIQRMHN
jgi:hypothetical protein